LRKALNHAVNHGELWQYCAKGNAYNLAGHIPPGVRGHNPNLTLYTYDTTRAKELLAEAGYPNGFKIAEYGYHCSVRFDAEKLKTVITIPQFFFRCHILYIVVADF
jgi:peptide/nickel transport system substrate-binding protein